MNKIYYGLKNTEFFTHKFYNVMQEIKLETAYKYNPEREETPLMTPYILE